MCIPNSKHGVFQGRKNGKQKAGFLRLFTLLMTVILLAAVTTAPVHAADGGKTEKECSLELRYQHDGHGIAESGVRLYRAAEVSADGEYTLTGPFAEYPLKVNGVQTQTEWKEAAVTLAAYAAADSVVPEQSEKTDANGIVRFSSLKTGLYLVISETAATDDGYCIFAPFLISLPGIDDSGNRVYDVSANPKSEAHEPSPEEIEHKVVKIWNDADYKRYRPKYITVDILKNGEKVSEQILSEANNWSYAWTAPDDGSVWQAVERKVPEHYTVTVREENNMITVTNTTTETVPDPKPPKTGDSRHTELYALAMALSGTVLLLLGIAKRRSDAHAEK